MSDYNRMGGDDLHWICCETYCLMTLSLQWLTFPPPANPIIMVCECALEFKPPQTERLKGAENADAERVSSSTQISRHHNRRRGRNSNLQWCVMEIERSTISLQTKCPEHCIIVLHRSCLLLTHRLRTGVRRSD